MNPQLITLANSFYVGAALIGVPSLVVAGWYAFIRVRLWVAPPVPVGDSFSGVKNPDAILMILGGFAKGVGALANFIGTIGQGILSILAVIASVGLVLAVVLFLTGRGLHAHAGWARAVGGGLMGFLLLTSLFASVAVFRGPLALAAFALAAASGYAIWTLWRGFAA